MSGDHSSVPKGTTAIVFMKNGSHVIAKFKMKDKGGVLKFYDHPDIKRKSIRGISPYKPNPDARHD